MTTYIALLRAINVGGHQKVGMAELRQLVEDLGFEDVQSLLQTGNLVFRGGERGGTGLERTLEVDADKRLGLRTAFLVRSAKELGDVIAHNPYREAAASDPSHVVVQFLKDAPQPAAVRALQASISGRETVRGWAKQLYVVYPNGIGRSKLTGSLIESKLATRGTGRNWNTVLKLADMAGA